MNDFWRFVGGPVDGFPAYTFEPDKHDACPVRWQGELHWYEPVEDRLGVLVHVGYEIDPEPESWYADKGLEQLAEYLGKKAEAPA
jgi:hypothetical protein